MQTKHDTSRKMVFCCFAWILVVSVREGYHRGASNCVPPIQHCHFDGTMFCDIIMSLKILYFFHQLFPYQLPCRINIILNTFSQEQVNIFPEIFVRHFFVHIGKKLFLCGRRVYHIFNI